MRVRITTIARWIVYFTMITSLSLLKPLGEILSMPFFSFDYAVRWTNIALIILSVILVMLKMRKRLVTGYIWGMVGLIVATFILRLTIDFMIGRNVYKEMNLHSQYLYPILAITIYALLEKKEIKLRRLIDMIIALTMMSFALRAGISLIYSWTGRRVLSSIALESAAENWIRDGVLRINPPCFSMIMVPLCMYQIETETERKKRLYYFAALASTILYSACVHRARSITIYQVLEMLFVIYIKKRNTIGKIIMFLLGCIGIGILVGSGALDQLADIFNANNELYSFSNSIRYIMYPYYFNMFLDHFWLGSGMLLGNELTFYSRIGTGALSDVGLLRTLVMLGSGMLTFFVVFFIRGYVTGIKTLDKTKDPADRILTLGIIFSVMLTVINIDCFFPIYAYAMPFCLAIPEYIITRGCSEK